MIGIYNLVFTSWPPIIIGLMDQFVTAPFLLAHPELYRFGQQNTFYNPKSFWLSVVNGFAQSFVAFGITAAAMWGDVTLRDGTNSNIWFMGSTCFAGILFTVVLKAALITKYSC